MARVIKGGQAAKSPRRAVPKLRAQAGTHNKVIEKEVYRAQQQAAELIAAAEQERERILAEGKQRAAQAREEAQAEGAQEAFEEAAQEALVAFRRRAERYGEAADDIRVLALEVVRKILGGDLHVPAPEVSKVIARGMSQLRARRRLRVQLPEERRQALLRDRPILMDRLAEEPDLVIEAAEDVSPGRARIVTEIGGALCSEQRALDQLAEALGVDEQAVAPAPQSAVVDLAEEQAALAATYESVEGEADVWTDDSDEAEPTEFLRGVDRAERERHREGTERSRRREDTEQEARARRRSSREAPTRPKERLRRKKAAAPEASDVERTMALDVSELREDLQEDPPSDELDLFADEAVGE